MDGQCGLKIIPNGFLGVNTGCVFNGQKALIIDPGEEAEKILAELGERELAAVLLTHSHFDHIGGVDALLDAFPAARLYCHPLCGKNIADPNGNLSAMTGASFQVRHTARELADAPVFTLADMEIRTFFVPGHTADSLCYYFPQNPDHPGWLFAGDTVFQGGVGRSDFPGGDGALLVRGIREMLQTLPPETQIFPGHGPATTVKAELNCNPYL